jgi:hypothetical protein
MDLSGGALAYPKTIFTPGSMGFTVDIGMNFIVQGQGTAVYLTFKNVLFLVDMELKDFLLYVTL